MASPVEISWGTSAGGGELNGGSVDHGSGINGTTLAESSDIYISHNGDNQITSAKFFLSTKTGDTGGYSGDASAAADLAELLSWGDGATANAFGGFQVNFDVASSIWPAYTGKDLADTSGKSQAFYTGKGDSGDNGILLQTDMGSGVTATGTMASGDTDVRFKCRIHIPLEVTNAGIKQFEQRLRYTFTS